MTGNPRIARRFEKLKSEGRAGLVAFVTAGDPNHALSGQIIQALPGAGADVIELGMPFSDPMADGPSVQASSQRALKNGASVPRTLELVREFRKIDQDCPIVLMGYFNPIYAYGPVEFLADAEEAGADGLIVVDLPPEEDELSAPLANSNIDMIYLATPTTDAARLPRVLDRASGYLYYVSVTGITGTKSANVTDVADAIGEIREHTALPIAVGFGIKTPEQAAEFGAFSDGVIVGSALVNKVAENVTDDGEASPACVDAVTDLVRDLASGLKARTNRGG